MNVPHHVLARLQTQQDRVRNICILAHVDHGKTTLSDNLIAANGIINPRLVGEMRYLDSRDDEQERGITMKSSSISLLHIPIADMKAHVLDRPTSNQLSSASNGTPSGTQSSGAQSQQSGSAVAAAQNGAMSQRPAGGPPGRRASPGVGVDPMHVSDEERVKLGYLINLIDSPGHVDFCSEVSTAVRLSDGALVVVDAVEGVCIQTHAVMRQAWQERVAPCLVINKIDRLVMEIQLTPSEAYDRVQRIVDEANGVMSALQAVDFLKRADDHADANAAAEADGAGPGEHLDEEDARDVFQPALGNVLFCSAADGWAFTIPQFASLYAAKLRRSQKTLSRALWGPYAFQPRAGAAPGESAGDILHVRKAKKNARPMFVQFALEPLWRVYSAAEPWNDGPSILGGLVKSQGLHVPEKLLQAEGKAAVRAVLRAWLPLAEATLTMAIAHLPSPRAAAPLRVPHLLSGMPTLTLPTEVTPSAVTLPDGVTTSAALDAATAALAAVTLNGESASSDSARAGEQAGGAGAAEPQGCSQASNRTSTGASTGASTGTSTGVSTWTEAAAAALGGGGGATQAEIEDSGLPLAVRETLARVQSSLTASSSSPDAPVVVYVSKMIALPAAAIPVAQGAPEPRDPDAEVFLAFGRVYSGVLRVGQRVHVLSAAYSPANPQLHRQTATVTSLYLMMGRGLERLTAVPAGNILAIGGLQDVILKSATVSSTPACPPLAPMLFQAAPIVQVAIEPALPNELPQLEAGLQLLNRADPFVEIRIDETGAFILGAAGEVHLETCVKDLRERFARVELIVSPPLARFRESVVHPAEVPDDSIAGHASAAPKVVETSVNGVLTIRVRAHPLPALSATALDAHANTLRACFSQPPSAALDAELEENVAELHEQLAEGADAAKIGSAAAAVSLRLQALTPPGSRPTPPKHTHLQAIESGVNAGFQMAAASGPLCEDPLWGVAFEVEVALTHSALAHGVTPLVPGVIPPYATSLRTTSGVTAPSATSLRTTSGATAAVSNTAANTAGNSGRDSERKCAAANTAGNSGRDSERNGSGDGVNREPSASKDDSAGVKDDSAGVSLTGFDHRSAASWARVDVREDVYGPLQGQVMTAVAGACRRAVEAGGVRLVEAQYLLQVATTAAALSSAIKVIKNRRGRILKEEMQEGMDLFLVTAYMPVEAALSKARLDGRADSASTSKHTSDSSDAYHRSGGGSGGGGNESQARGSGGGSHAAQRAPMSFADQLRRETSGAASASLALSHWERLHVDPHWRAKSEEDREAYGEAGTLQRNVAKMLANVVRARKGLPLIDAKVVEDGTKQRTRARKV